MSKNVSKYLLSATFVVYYGTVGGVALINGTKVRFAFINGTKVRFPEKKKRFMGQISVCQIKKKKIDSEYSLPR